MKLSISSDFDKLASHLSQLAEQLDGDLTEPMSGIAQMMAESTRKRFETKTAPDGSKWAGLSPKTEKIKAQKGTLGRGILIDEGLLKNITAHATASMATVGTAVHYAKYHQDGTSKMAQRKIFGLSDEDLLDIRDALTDFLDELWSES